MSMTTTIAFPLSTDLQDDAVQRALAELADDLGLMLHDCALAPAQVAQLALALCGAIPGSAVDGLVVHGDRYFLAGEPTDPIIIVVQIISGIGCTDLHWPICPPGPRWDGAVAQHAAAAAFLTSVCA